MSLKVKCKPSNPELLKRICEDYFWMEFEFDGGRLRSDTSIGKIVEFIDLLEQEEDRACLRLKLSYT